MGVLCSLVTVLVSVLVTVSGSCVTVGPFLVIYTVLVYGTTEVAAEPRASDEPVPNVVVAAAVVGMPVMPGAQVGAGVHGSVVVTGRAL